MEEEIEHARHPQNRVQVVPNPWKTNELRPQNHAVGDLSKGLYPLKWRWSENSVSLSRAFSPRNIISSYSSTCPSNGMRES
jgi:hypothetical protein